LAVQVPDIGWLRGRQKERKINENTLEITVENISIKINCTKGIPADTQ